MPGGRRGGARGGPKCVAALPERGLQLPLPAGPPRGLGREVSHSRTGPRVAVKFGRQKINLRPMGEDTVAWFTGANPMPGSDDLCFITAQPMRQVLDHFASVGVALEVGPVERTGALGAMQSVYCRDPDGNLVEVAVY